MHLDVPWMNDPMFWSRISFLSALVVVILVKAITLVARQQMITQARVTYTKQQILELIKYV